MRSAGVLVVTVVIAALVRPADAGDADEQVGDAGDAGDALDAYAGTGCLFEGVRYRPGQPVPVRGEPCLRCRCRRGAPVCRLRVCAPLPDPPPRGCVLLHRANTCCPQLHCPDDTGTVDNRLEARRGNPMSYRADGPNKGCYINGSLFAEGSALSTSSLCDYCYCVRGQQRCVRPQCVLPAPGCTPEYRDHTCCPTRYHCDGNSSSSSSSTPKPKRRVTGCTVDGRRYREGAQVKSVARGQCETCFCMQGQVRCAPLKCDLPLDGCQPVTAPGKCCPVSYDCSKSRVSITKTVSSSSSGNSKSSNGRPTKGENVVRSISYDARSNREISSTDTSKVTIDTGHVEQNVISTTQQPFLEDPPTILTTALADNIAITLNTRLDLGDNLDMLRSQNNTILPEKNKILPVIEAMINKTRQKDQDYDYDYNEPTLPPSLPNLRIIPFVAADAVVPEDKSNGQDLPNTSNVVESKQPKDKIDNFYFFSPPAETEGGFIPRDPSVDGPYYQHKYAPESTEIKHETDFQQKTSSSKGPLEDTTIRTVIPEAVTPDPLLGNAGSAPCMSAGRRYRHGELLTGMGACRMCFCFDGGVVCQEPSCGAVPPGCTRGPPPAPPRDSEPERCCGSIICGDADRDSPLLFADVPEALVVHDKSPGEAESSPTPERRPVIEPAPELVPSATEPPLLALFTKRPVTKPQSVTTPSTTSTTSSPPSTTTAKIQRRKPSTSRTPTTANTPTSTTASTAISTSTVTSTTSRKTTPRPFSKPKTTTSKTPSATSTFHPTTTTTLRSTTKPPTTTAIKTTAASSTAGPTTVASTTMASTSMASTIASSTTMYSKPSTSTATPPPSRKTPVSTPQPTVQPTSTPTPRPTAPSTTTSIVPIRKGRPTTTPTSLFAALWGDEDDSANEAQDKVDEDVQYHDFVSTNEHEQPPQSQPSEPPLEDDDEGFSFDKFLELFMNPDKPAATTPSAPRTPPSTVRPPAVITARTTTSTSMAPITTSTMASMNVDSTPGSTSTQRSNATSTQTTQKSTPLPTQSSPSSTPSPSSSSTTVASTSTGKDFVTVTMKTIPSNATAPKVPPPTKKTSSAPKPLTSTAKPAAKTTARPPAKPSTKPTIKPTTKTTAKPAVKPTASSTPRTTHTSTTTTTPRATEPPSTTSSAGPVATTPAASVLTTLPPSTPILRTPAAVNKYKTGSSHSSSYPAEQHHLSTRRPPPRLPAKPPSPPSPPLLGPAYISTTTLSTTPRRPAVGGGSDPAAALSGLLKLAGCNIYGRMYRVGRIIQELSGPCLECRCTEVGVQCQQLAC